MSEFGLYGFTPRIKDVNQDNPYWRDDAKCLGDDLLNYWPDKHETPFDFTSRVDVKKVCEGCPVKRECAVEAIITQEEGIVRGGKFVVPSRNNSFRSFVQPAMLEMVEEWEDTLNDTERNLVWFTLRLFTQRMRRLPGVVKLDRNNLAETFRTYVEANKEYLKKSLLLVSDKVVERVEEPVSDPKRSSGAFHKKVLELTKEERFSSLLETLSEIKKRK